jgi:hypothetical protein
MKRAILFLILAASVGAQTANVIELEPVDAVKAQKVWDTLQKAQADYDFTLKILGEKYTLVKSGDPDAGNASTGIDVPVGTGYTSGVVSACNTIQWQDQNKDCPMPSKEELEKRAKEQKAWDDEHFRYYRKGFEGGFEFSKDFRFIVPKKTAPMPIINMPWYASPATGTYTPN